MGPFLPTSSSASGCTKWPPRVMTLRLDVESVAVVDIKGVRYDTNRREVNRDRRTKGEERDF